MAQQEPIFNPYAQPYRNNLTIEPLQRRFLPNYDGTADGPDDGVTYFRCTPLGRRYLKWGGVFIFFGILIAIFYVAGKAAGGRVVVHPTKMVRHIGIDAAQVPKCNVSFDFEIDISRLDESTEDVAVNKYTFSNIKIDCPQSDASTHQKRGDGNPKCLILTDTDRQAFKCPGIDGLIYPDEWLDWNGVPDLTPLPTARRWVEWYNPAKCGNQEECSKSRKLRIIIYVVLGITGVCTLILIILQCISCIRRKGVVSRDLKAIMTGQMQSLAPRPHGPPITFSLDGHSVEGTAESRNQRDSEAMLGGIDEEPCKSLDGTPDGWTSWLFSQKHNKAARNLRPAPRIRVPRIPSLTLPQPCLSTVRKVSGLEIYKDESDDEKMCLNQKPKSKIRWSSFR